MKRLSWRDETIKSVTWEEIEIASVGRDKIQSLLLLFQEIKMATYWSMIIGSLKIYEKLNNFWLQNLFGS